VKGQVLREVCPVNQTGGGSIHPPRECIDCQACEAACPVQAIFPDNGIPEKWRDYIEKNKKFFENK
jgi:ferredoxin